MKNKLYLLLITVMACFALSACGDSDEGTKEMKTYEYDNSGDVVIENDSLKLSVSGSSTQLEVTDKATGKVYRSNPTAVSELLKCHFLSYCELTFFSRMCNYSAPRHLRKNRTIVIY